MPTRIDMDDLTPAETAQTSDVAWMRAQLADDNRLLNDTTLSGSLLEEALQDLHRPTSVAPPTPQEHPPLHSVDHELSMDEHSSADVSLHLPSIPSSTDRAGMGPQEQRYRAKYADYVEAKISESKHDLRDYRQMNDEERAREQRHVMSLLQRLGINGATQLEEDLDETIDPHVGTRSVAGMDESLADKDDDRTIDPDEESLHKPSQPGRRSVSFAAGLKSDKSVNVSTLALLSPPGYEKVSNLENSANILSSPEEDEEGADESMILLTPIRQDNDDENSNSSSSSTASVELPRHDTGPFRSPSPLRWDKKRLASTSGKRGADTSRSRNDETPMGWNRNSPRDDDDDSSSAAMVDSSLEEFAPPPAHFFSASQSPITPRPTCSPLADRESPPSPTQPPVLFNDDDSEDEDSVGDYRAVDDTIQYTQVRGSSRQPFGDRNVVGMQAGATFHLKPLEMLPNPRSRRSRPASSFPDPLERYEGSLGRQLGRVYKKLRVHDKAADLDSTLAQAMVLALEPEQVRDVVLKLVLRHHDKSERHTSSRGAPGQTLVVVREREELDDWSRTFREGSPFSVLNHAILPVKERKSPSTTEKVMKYDVVLTTFDAFKSSDMTCSVGSNGLVQLEQNNADDDGWFTSRSASQPATSTIECKQFSVLHRIAWRRVIFTDIVGRKAFLVKKDTTRFIAARALNADARYVPATPWMRNRLLQLTVISLGLSFLTVRKTRATP